ncbi:transposase [Paenibacillus antibioticophila]|uniref:Transposase n=1 Tax=Paenibacillus antibioticophila TaxID=1274374 RepID=A0A920CE38_9BACL|nr:helix-turn-helix domain-containing protein [Paenibacillus antibioticophila]GIO36536.1 transposase [Paenibacillus antibioticophila]
MDYMSAKDAALKWGISKRRVQTLCAEDRIKGASKVGIFWVIPKDAEKPEDERLKINKN